MKLRVPASKESFWPGIVRLTQVSFKPDEIVGVRTKVLISYRQFNV